MKRLFRTAIGIIVFLISKSALAQEEIVEAVSQTDGVLGFKAIFAITAGLTIAAASVGGAIGQGKVATAAMEGIARNPEAASKVMTPMIISLALIESLVIYALVIAFLLQGKI